MSELLGAAALRRGLLASLDVLRSRRAAIDAANVYPVPDGDTGTNLVLTFEAVAQGLGKAGENDAEVTRAAKTSSLMGARGNSGVIMAQILRGWCEVLEAGPADTERLAQGFKRAVELAYEAVLEPAEGTILTVARAASDAAQGAHGSPASLFEAVARAAADALARTPEQLPVLARAGVVDAGGMGLLAVLEAFAATLNGREVAADPAPDASPAHPSTLCEGEQSAYAHEVQYLLDAADDTVPPLRQLLGTIGDSVAVVGGDGRWRVHVHTDDVERAVGFGRALGAVSGVETVTFAEQIAAATEPRQPASPAETGERAVGERGIPVATADAAATLVVVAAGAGMHRLFAELGASVVDGGATMNPSVGELLAAVEAAPTEDVVVLPNNENVFAAAGAARGETTKNVQVIRTGDMAEGLAAALAFSSSSSAERAVLEMNQAITQVRTGQVVLASRSAETPSGEVESGQPIGFAEGAFVTPTGDASDPIGMACAVIDALARPGDEMVTILCGVDARPEERERLAAEIAERFPRLTVEMHDGGQPVHRYLLAVE